MKKLSDERFKCAAISGLELQALTRDVRKHGLGMLWVSAMLALLAITLSPGNLGFPIASLATAMLAVVFFSIGYSGLLLSKVLILFAARTETD